MHDVLCDIDDDVKGFGFGQLQFMSGGLRRGLRLSPALGRGGYSEDKCEEQYPQYAGDGRRERCVGEE